MAILIGVVSCTTRLSPTAPDANPAGFPTTAPAGSLLLSPQNTRITFIGTALANSHEGTFAQFYGLLAWPDDPHLFVEIKMDSVYTKIDLLTRHLKSDEFFDVTRFPTATFVSTQIKTNGDAAVINGNFTIHGISKNVLFPAHFTVDPKVISLDATITLRQSDFKMESTRTTTDSVPVTVSARIAR